MKYNSKPEDLQFYDRLITLEILPHLQTFLALHEEIVTKAFEDMVAKAKSEEKSEQDTRFIQELNCEEFINVVKFTFCVIFSKDMDKVAQKHNYNKLSSLAAQSMAKKMANNPYNPTYVGQLDRVVSICCNSVLSAYRAQSE